MFAVAVLSLLFHIYSCKLIIFLLILFLKLTITTRKWCKQQFFFLQFLYRFSMKCVCGLESVENINHHCTSVYLHFFGSTFIAGTVTKFRRRNSKPTPGDDCVGSPRTNAGPRVQTQQTALT